MVKRRQYNPAEPELMDRPGEPDAVWRKNLANLRSLNRWFGAYRIVRRFLEPRTEPGRRYRVLDLATGAADIPADVVLRARSRGVEVEVDAVDCHPATLAVAAGELGSDYPEIRLVEGDALEFGAGGDLRYDFVLCSLALHHFSDAEAVAVMRRVRELAGQGGLVADLDRSWLTAAGVHLATGVLYRDPMTVADARQSVRAAFSAQEFRAVAAQAGWAGFTHQRFLYGRQAVWFDAPVPPV